MARRTNTYAIRLAGEGGGQVKAELVSVGQSGEQSLKRIESAGDRASGGLEGGLHAALAGPCSRYLTGQPVDLLSLDGEVSWQWEDYFRVAAAMQAAAH